MRGDLRILILSTILGVFDNAHAQALNDSVVYLYAYDADEKNAQFGTGFFVKTTGEIVTAYHVIANSKKLKGYDSSGKRINDFRVHGIDPLNDVAILSSDHIPKRILKLEAESQKAGASLRVVGHPDGFKYQTITTQTTQDGTADSMGILAKDGKGIFLKSIQIIPLNLLTYDGMSGAPIVNGKDEAIGILSGSLNTGGSLAWGIPANQAISMLRRPGLSTDLASMQWPPMDALRSGLRSLQTANRNISAEETVAWINSTWNSKGLREFTVDGFKVRLKEELIELRQEGKALNFSATYEAFGEEFEASIILSLENASRASVKLERGRSQVFLECPSDRVCIREIIKKQVKAQPKTVRDAEIHKAILSSWPLVDADSTSKMASAINHLIRLNGGPVQRNDLFGKK